jgi:hypothetical protein
MRKLLATLSLFSFTCAAYANSTVTMPLPADNTIKANSTAELKLDFLSSNIPYKITCNMESAAPMTLAMSFAPILAPHGGFGVVSLNGKETSHNVLRLAAGQNSFSFMTSVADNKNLANTMQFKNLDDRYSVTLKSCQAEPVPNVTALTGNSNLMRSGSFYIQNNLGFFLDVTVGNYVPTAYCIPPMHTQYVSVTTDNQNVNIITIHH